MEALGAFLSAQHYKSLQHDNWIQGTDRDGRAEILFVKHGDRRVGPKQGVVGFLRWPACGKKIPGTLEAGSGKFFSSAFFFLPFHNWEWEKGGLSLLDPSQRKQWSLT